MTSISSTSAATAATQAPAAAGSGNKATADFNMFLKLLTAQMKNQDPLSPMNATEYTQQLVQYSQVEQSIQQTAALKDILAGLASQTMAQATSFIGMEAQFQGSMAGLDATSGSASWSYSAQEPVAQMTATISDATGKVMKTMDLGSNRSSGRIVWDGQTVGGRAPEGPYSLSVIAVDAAGNPVPVQITALGTVRTVSSVGNKVMLGTGGISLPISSLLAVSGVAATGGTDTAKGG
jgi:flagellar basal-body rod modification protein FlgD